MENPELWASRYCIWGITFAKNSSQLGLEIIGIEEPSPYLVDVLGSEYKVAKKHVKAAQFFWEPVFFLY